MIWHSAEAEEVLHELQVDGKTGLPNGVAEERLLRYGKNVITNVQQPTFLTRFLSQLKSKTVVALIIIALVSFSLSVTYGETDVFSPLLIIAIVIANAALGAWQMHNCDRAADEIKSVTNPTAAVLRDSIVRTVDSALLVPGDIIILEEGDYIPADARIIECNEFRCNESPLTGDEIPVEKSSDVTFDDITDVKNRANMLFSGTSVAHGSAKAVVVATGLNTEIGRDSAIMQQIGANSVPLEKELDGLSRTVNIIIFVICTVTFVIGMVQNFSSTNFAGMTVKMLMNSVALAVAAVPEGLPAISAVVIAIGIGRIVRDNIIIKDSASLETLGRTDIICTDKTGVLTRNKMHLAAIFDGDKLTNFENDVADEKTLTVLKLAAACSTLKNDSTEDAIKKACLTYNSMSQKDIDSFFPKLGVVPFDPERKTMTVITMINEKPYAIVKGAAENVVPNCVGCDADLILKMNEQLANDALRIVCVAIRPLDGIPANPNPADTECNLIFVGLLGLLDPPRNTVVNDIKTCEKAGIRTVMITGDNLSTASAVARRIGILKDGTKAVTGEELDLIDDDTLTADINDYSVFARVSPHDKTRIVKAWQNNGRTVAITGDSVQDAEALSLADVGCAIGRFGTDVAKGNADIVITNNRFSSIVNAVRESRGLFDNIKKAVFYLLSCNFAELLTVLVGILWFSAFPVSAVQLLWINFLTDSAPAAALGMESAEPSVMNREPDTAVGKFFSGKTVLRLILQSIFISAATLAAYVIGKGSGAETAATMSFGVLSMSQIFHCYNNKFTGSVINRKLFSNRFMNLSSALILFIIVFLMFTPAGRLFGMTVLTFKQFSVVFGLSFLVVPLCEILKLM